MSDEKCGFFGSDKFKYGLYMVRFMGLVPQYFIGNASYLRNYLFNSFRRFNIVCKFSILGKIMETILNYFFNKWVKSSSFEIVKDESHDLEVNTNVGWVMKGIILTYFNSIFNFDIDIDIILNIKIYLKHMAGIEYNMEVYYVLKRNNDKEEVSFDKILKRIKVLSTSLNINSTFYI